MDERMVAIELARQAGEIFRARWDRVGLVVESKGAIDLVTEVDHAAEALIAQGLRRTFPEHGMLAEEGSGWPARTPGGPRWIVDPLDGTTNYVRGIPIVAVSIGFESDGELALGVVYNPITDELFVGERGGGATLNGKPIHTGPVREIGQAVLTSGFPYDVWTNPDDNTAVWRALAKQCLSIRCDGSSALDLCQVACGRFDGYWEKGIQPWDVAAGAVIVREAGGTVCDYAGGGDFLARGEIVAGNAELVEGMRREIDKARIMNNDSFRY